MKQCKVTIYALIDPFKLKVRYIGRTQCSLNKRLGEHITKAKYDYNRTHKNNWIKKLLSVNSKPYIRKLCEIDGWEESYRIEAFLIQKYKNRLLNHKDKGPGMERLKLNIKSRKKIAGSLKKFYSIHKIKTCEVVYCYNFNGTFHKKYESQKDASRELGMYFQSVSKCVRGVKKHAKGYQFSNVFLDKMEDLTNNMNVCIIGVRRK